MLPGAPAWLPSASGKKDSPLPVASQLQRTPLCRCKCLPWRRRAHACFQWPGALCCQSDQKRAGDNNLLGTKKHAQPILRPTNQSSLSCTLACWQSQAASRFEALPRAQILVCCSRATSAGPSAVKAPSLVDPPLPADCFCCQRRLVWGQRDLSSILVDELLKNQSRLTPRASLSWGTTLLLVAW